MNEKGRIAAALFVVELPGINQAQNRFDLVKSMMETTMGNDAK